MRQIFITVLLISLFPAVVQGQQAVESGNQFGLMLGLSMHDIELGNEVPDFVQYRRKLLIPVGIFFETPVIFPRNLSLRVESVYSRRNEVFTISDSTGTDDYRMRFSALSFPFALKYRFGKGKVRPFISAGPSIGVYFGTETELVRETRNSNGSVTLERSDLDAINPFDIGGAFGLGVAIPANLRHEFGVEAKYQIRKSPDEVRDHRMNEVQLLVSYNF